MHSYELENRLQSYAAKMLDIGLRRAKFCYITNSETYMDYAIRWCRDYGTIEAHPPFSYLAEPTLFNVQVEPCFTDERGRLELSHINVYLSIAGLDTL